jgi:hypothetical protein
LSSSSSVEEIDLILVSTDEEDNEDGAHCLHHRHLFSEHKGGDNGYASLNVNGAGEHEDLTLFTACLDT